MASQITVPLPQLTGPMFVGLCLNWGLFGCSMVQVYYYHCFFPKDSRRFKTFVYSLYVWDFAQTLVFTQDWFNIFAQNFGSHDVLEEIGTSWFSVPFMNGISSPIIQCFYAWRVYHLSKSYILSGAIVLIAIMSGAASLAFGFLMHFRMTLFSELRIQPAATIGTLWLVGSTACDIIICASMVFYLQRARRLSHHPRTGSILQRLTRLTVGAGVATAFCSATDITLYLACQQTNYYIAPAVIIGKLYVNSFLVLINSRRRQEFDEGMSMYVWDSDSNPPAPHRAASRRVSLALEIGIRRESSRLSGFRMEPGISPVPSVKMSSRPSPLSGLSPFTP